MEHRDRPGSPLHRWGAPGGPPPGTIMMTPGSKVDTAQPLKRAPAACGGNDDDESHGGR